jgi:hypothetical protein
MNWSQRPRGEPAGVAHTPFSNAAVTEVWRRSGRFNRAAKHLNGALPNLVACVEFRVVAQRCVAKTRVGA